MLGGAPDVFFQISNFNYGVMVRSQIIKKASASGSCSFKPVAISMDKVCGGDLDAPITIAFYDMDWSDALQHRLMGRIITSVRELQESTVVPTDGKKRIKQESFVLKDNGTKCGKVIVTHANIVDGPTDNLKSCLKQGVAGEELSLTACSTDMTSVHSSLTSQGGSVCSVPSIGEEHNLNSRPELQINTKVHGEENGVNTDASIRKNKNVTFSFDRQEAVGFNNQKGMLAQRILLSGAIVLYLVFFAVDMSKRVELSS